MATAVQADQAGPATALVGRETDRAAQVAHVGLQAPGRDPEGSHDGQCGIPLLPVRPGDPNNPESKRFSIRYQIHSACLVRPQSKPNSAS